MSGRDHFSAADAYITVSPLRWMMVTVVIRLHLLSHLPQADPVCFIILLTKCEV